MKKNLLFISAVLIAIGSYAQEAAVTPETPEAQWYNIIDSSTTSGDQATDIAVDSDGNVYWYGNYGSTESLPDVKFNDEVLYQGALYNAGNSVNNNYTVVKTNAQGQKLWAVYSNSGDFANNSGFCAVTSDGGLVTVAKVRHTDGMTDKNINLVDASGRDVAVDWTCDRRFYRLLVTKLSGDGEVEWNRMIDCSTTPGEAAAGNNAEFWADCFNLTGGTVDNNDNIYIALNYRNPMTVASASGAPVVLTPEHTASWTGDAQAVAGDFLLLGLDSNGYYRNNLQLEGDCAASYCQKIIFNNGRLYAQGYIVGVENQTLKADGFTLAPSTIMSPVVICADTDLDVKWAKCFAGEQVAGKNALQNVGLSLINGRLYMCGQFNLKFTDPDNSANFVAATQGSVREGFIVGLNAEDGAWLAARNSREDDWNKPSAVAKTGLTGYFSAFPNPLSTDKIYVFGYVMNANVGVFLRVYDAATLEGDLDGQYNIVTGGGVPSCQCATYDADSAAVYVNARGNKAFNLMPDLTTPAVSTWAVLCARFDLPTSSQTGIDTVIDSMNDEFEVVEAEYFNLQGVRVDNPAAGLYIVRRGREVTKEFIR